jgi:translocation and assembly module TamA
MRFIPLLLIISSLHATPISNLRFAGDIDPVIGSFTKDALLQACGFATPPFYKFWQKNPTVSAQEVEECAQTLTQYAHSYGFYKAQISPTFTKESATLHVKKNAPIRIASLEASEGVRPLVPFEEGDVFSPHAYTEVKRTIKNHYATLGYPKAELDTKAYVDLEAYRVDIYFRIDLRGVHTFGPISITNNANVEEALLREYIYTKKGERYNAKELEKTHEALYDLGIYRYIGINQNLDKSDATVPVDITLDQGEYREVAYGFGYDTDTGGRLNGHYKNSNFKGNLKQLSLGGTLSGQGASLYNTLFLPRLFWSDPLLKNVTLTNDITLEDKDYESYEQRKIDETITFSKNFWGINHAVGISSEISRIESKISGHEGGNYWINAFFYRAVLDKRDDPIDPKRGYYLSFFIENGAKFLASEEEYLKTLSEFRVMESLGDLKASYKAKIGTINTQLPIFKRFFAGGDYSNRGYQYQKVGRLDTQGNPYGGLSLIDTALELEYAIMQELSVATFLDSTMLEESPNTFTDDFLHSVGLGIRYYTPIGPLRLDVGMPLDEDGFTFHLGIGQVF